MASRLLSIKKNISSFLYVKSLPTLILFLRFYVSLTLTKRLVKRGIIYYKYDPFPLLFINLTVRGISWNPLILRYYALSMLPVYNYPIEPSRPVFLFLSLLKTSLTILICIVLLCFLPNLSLFNATLHNFLIILVSLPYF